MSTGEAACPLCGSSRAAPLFTKRRPTIGRCAACTFRFATPDVNPNLTQTLDGYEDALPSVPRAGCERQRQLRGALSLDGGVRDARGHAAARRRGRERQAGRFLRGRGIDAQGIEPSRALFDRFLAGHAEFTSRHARRAPRIGPADIRHRHRVRRHRACARPRRISARGLDVSRARRHFFRVHARRREPDSQAVRPQMALLLIPIICRTSGPERSHGRPRRTDCGCSISVIADDCGRPPT